MIFLRALSPRWSNFEAPSPRTAPHRHAPSAATATLSLLLPSPRTGFSSFYTRSEKKGEKKDEDEGEGGKNELEWNRNIVMRFNGLSQLVMSTTQRMRKGTSDKIKPRDQKFARQRTFEKGEKAEKRNVM